MQAFASFRYAPLQQKPAFLLNLFTQSTLRYRTLCCAALYLFLPYYSTLFLLTIWLVNYNFE
jgi:hypothetical protein